MGSALKDAFVTLDVLSPMADVYGAWPSLSQCQKQESPLRPQSHRSVRNWLVGGEVALSVVLVVCAGLLIRSFVQLEIVDLGFRTEHALSFRLDLGVLVNSEDERGRQYAEIESRLLQQPGIEATGATVRPILGGGAGGEDTTTILGRERILRFELVTPGYFATMRTPLMRGRFLDKSDTSKAKLVVVVNSAFERAYFPDPNTLGKRIGLKIRVEQSSGGSSPPPGTKLF